MWRKRHMFHSEILCIALPKASNTPSSYKMHFFIIFYYISFRSQVFNQSLNHLFIKKNWKTNLHIMQPMCHIPICLPSSQSSLLTSLLNCSQSVSHLMLLIILVACSWFFSSSMLSFFFYVSETRAELQMHCRLIQLYHEAPLYCSLFLS